MTNKEAVDWLNAIKEKYIHGGDERLDELRKEALDLAIKALRRDNAPTVELTEEQAIDKLHETGWLIRHDKEMTERPQGECRTCIHRDPEDKKCDCGELERAGCQFPVSDDYFCKFYEKGGSE